MGNYIFYTRATGTTQGKFPSESERAKDRGAVCYRFQFGGKTSNDPTRAVDFAARSHEPVFILKPWGEASAHYAQAFWGNEVLSEVVMEFVRTDPGGTESPLETITLTNATIASLKRHAGELEGFPEPELEEIGLRFEKMEIMVKGAKKSVKFDFKNRK